MRGPAAFEPLQHPGPPGRQRTITAATRTTPVLVDLPAGSTVLAALSAAARAHGVTAAQIELLGGTFGRLSYCVPAECRDGTRAMSYSSTRHARGPVNVVGGSVTLGTRAGAPFMHCHAVWLDTAGLMQAGHVWPDTTVGALGVRAVLYPLPAVTSRSRDDPETLLPVFTPAAETPKTKDPLQGEEGKPGDRAVLARVLPGESLQAAIELICRNHDIRRGLIRASLGSFLGPLFLDGADTMRIPGPCTEFVSLLGEFGPDADPTAAVHTVVVDSSGAVHAGVIDPHRSLIAVTAEFLVLDNT